MKNILIFSNNGLSSTEPNGRIFASLFVDLKNVKIHNFCFGGINDLQNVKYIQFSAKTVLKSLLSFGFFKPSIFFGNSFVICNKPKKRIKKTSFKSWLRNKLYMINPYIFKTMNKYVITNEIDMIFTFGTDVSFLYKLARQLARKNHIKVITYTGENYPFKDYNYIEKGKDHNLFFKSMVKSLSNETKKLYSMARKCFFTSQELLNLYQDNIGIINSDVKSLPSLLNKVDYKPRTFKNILYAGNLYTDRIKAILDVAEVAQKCDESIKLNLYGVIKDGDLRLLSNHPNIHYHGIVNYEKLLEQYKNADLLLHVEGFDEYYLKDCKYAFSTKICDCYKLGIPFFMYGPLEIVGTSYCLSVSKEFVATSKLELDDKLSNVLRNKTIYVVDTNKIKKDFRPFEESDFD